MKKRRPRVELILRLRSGWLSPGAALRCREGGFPLERRPEGCPLRYPIATQTALQSSARLPGETVWMFSMTERTISLASFAGNISGGYRSVPWPGKRGAWLLHPQIPLKAGYAAHSTGQNAFVTHRNTGSSPVRRRIVYRKGVRPSTESGLHTGRVGTPMPLGAALQMQARSAGSPMTSPQHPPGTGRSKQTQEAS